MENKNWKYIKRKTQALTLIDVRMEFTRESGIEVPLNHGWCGDVEYIFWLENKLVDVMNLKKKLIPWEK
jgi:hypothetical protein